MLLIVTNKGDLASDYLILRLEELNIPFWRLNTEDYLSKYQIDINLKNNGIDSSINYYNGTVINTNEITGVYFRQPIVPDFDFGISESECDFAQRESLEVLRSLWRIIDENVWLNHPKYLLIANNKIDQLQRAIKLGFKIPPTCISTDLEKMRKFYDIYNGELIAKAVKHGFYKTRKNVQIASTQMLTDEFFDNANYAKVPMILQKYIKKQYDIRVTIVGKNVYSTSIHSQEHEQTKVDWRLWDLYPDIDLKHTKFELPQYIENLCLKITQKFNLNYSAIDLIYSVDNEYYFLEMNPNGQWVWIEEKVGFPIRDSIIDLIGG